MSDHRSDPYIRIKDACKVTGLSPSTMQRLCDAGKVRGIRVNERGDRRIVRTSLLEFMSKQGIPDGLA